MKKTMIIMNPSSGRQTAANAAADLMKRIWIDYDELILKPTKVGGDITHFVEQACADQYHTIYVLGGDGSVSEAINGMAEKEYRPRLAIIPTGTINNFPRIAHIPININQAIQVAAEGHSQPTDVAKVNNDYFVSTLSMGALPESAKNVTVEEKTALGPLAYIANGLRAIESDQVHPHHIIIDDEDVTENYGLVIVGLGNSISGIENFFDSANNHDGLLHFMGIKESTMLEKISLLPSLVGKDTQQTNLYDVRDFKKMHIALAEDVQIGTTVDGDDGPELPIDIEILPSHIDVIGQMVTDNI